MEVQNIVLEDLLNKYAKTFQIPENQRNYVWNKTEFQTLILDLTQNMKKNVVSFLGTICLSGNEQNKYLIVDGQQRITTLCMILYILQKRLDERVLVPSFLESKIKEDITKASLPCADIARMIGAIVEDDRAFLTYLLRSVQFVVLCIPNEKQHQIFDSINSAGKALAIHELIYNDLCRSCSTYNKEKLTTLWKTFLAFMEGTYDVAVDISNFTEEDFLEKETDNYVREEAGISQSPNQLRRLNYNNYFKVVSRLNCNKKRNQEVYYAATEHLNEVLQEVADKGVAGAEYLLTCARYYALFVAPMKHLHLFDELFPEASKEFIKAVVNYSTLGLGDALPLLLRLSLEENAGGKEQKIEELTAYLEGIFQIYMQACVSGDSKLRRAILRRLPGLEYEVREGIRSGNLTGKLRHQIQQTLVGSLGDRYTQAWGKMDDENNPAISRLRYQGERKIITSLMIAETLNRSEKEKVDLLNWLKEIADKGGFSVEHIIPQSKQGDCDLQQLGNLVLLERYYNSEAGNDHIEKKIEVYQKSHFKNDIYLAVKSLYLQENTKERNIEKSGTGCESQELWKELVSDKTNPSVDMVKTRTKCVSKDLWKILERGKTNSVSIPDNGKKKLVYVEDWTADERRWTWRWEDPKKIEDKNRIRYYDDGQNSKAKRTEYTIQGIYATNGLEWNGQLDIPNCTKTLIYILWHILNKEKLVDAECYASAIKTAANENSGYAGYVSLKPIVHARSVGKREQMAVSQFIFEGNDTSSSIQIYLSSNQSNYAENIPGFFGKILSYLGVNEEKIPAIYLKYNKNDFRPCNGAFYSPYAFIVGNKRKYMDMLQNKTEKSDRAATQLGDRSISAKNDFCDSSYIVESSIVTLEELVAKKIYIPMYQRRYVWTQDNWERLIKNIHSIGDNQKEFFGILLLGEREDGGYDLIDGQQRLTTLSYVFPNLGLKEQISFYDEELDVFYRNGAGTYGALNSFVSTYKDRTDNEYAGRIQFLVLKLKHMYMDRASELFTTINGRGRRLTPGEIIKNYILMQANEFSNFDIDKARAMWKDSDRFETFIKAYIDMTKSELIAQDRMVDTVRELYEDGDFSVWLLPYLGSNGKEYLEFLKNVDKLAKSGDQEAIWLSESVLHLNFEELRDKQSFFEKMQEYWKYFEELTLQLKTEVVKMKKADPELFGELYLHQLVGTHTTYPPLLYHYANWKKADESLKIEKRSNFLKMLRRFTDAFLICHMCGYENSLKSIDRRMTKFCVQAEGSHINDLLSVEAVFGMDSQVNMQDAFACGLAEKDLYHKRLGLALLFAWRCEQTFYKNNYEFYERVVAHEVDKPSIEHICPQAENKLWTEYMWNYAIMEKEKNSSASKKRFSEKKEIYKDSSYRILKYLATSESFKDLEEFKEESCKQFGEEIFKRLTGEYGLNYIGETLTNN